MQVQISARKQALKENDVHTPTFSAPTFAGCDSVPRLANPVDPPSPTISSSKQHNLDNKWGISFERKDEEVKELNNKEFAEVFQLKAPSMDEHVRLAKLVVKLRMKRNRELHSTRNRHTEKRVTSAAQMTSTAQPIEARLHSQLHRYHRMLTARDRRHDHEAADSTNADYESSDGNDEV